MCAAVPADAQGVKKVAAVVLLIIAVNLVPRVVGVPAFDFPSFDVPDWLRHLNLAKNVIIGALIALAVLGAVLKSRDH